MPQDLPYWLHSVNVVVTAEFHNPSILNPDFLESKEIVPSDWTVTEAITTPQVSFVRYENEVQWVVEQAKLTVAEATKEYESPFRDDYLVYELVKAYLAILPHVPYRSLGLNCVVSIKQDEPRQWLTQRFLKPGPWLEGDSKVLGMAPKFTLDADNAVCDLSFSEGQTTSPQGESETAVIINSNVHHAGPLDADGLCMAIDHWPEKQNFVISALDKFLKQPQI